jgi:XTP/dITP diphosphohydrolase
LKTYTINTGSSLVIATHNQGKTKEFRDLLKPLGINIIPLTDFGLPEPEETGLTFAENSEIKSLTAARKTGEICLADDSGLCVTDLAGEPGIYSARWAGKPANFNQGMTKIHTKLLAAHATLPWKAQFICDLSLTWPDDHTLHFSGQIDGHIVWPMRGKNGFGYDPMFQPSFSDKTFGEMTADVKNACNHRARAIEKMLAYLEETLSHLQH